MARIEIHDLTKRFGGKTAVDAVDFEVPAGRVVGFVGPNGAGKTTTLRCLLGLVGADEGSATIDSRAYFDLPHPLRTVGSVLEGAAFYPGRRGIDHVRIAAQTAGVPDTKAHEAIDLVGMTEHARKRIRTYSMGMKQRLAIAEALVGDPELLVLDEPTNGLDPGGIRWMRSLIREKAAAGGAVLISSHLLGEVALTVDEVVIVANGKVVRTASIEELEALGTAQSKVSTPDKDGLIASLRARDIAAVEQPDGSLLVQASAEVVGEIAAAGSLVLHELTPLGTSLEEAFFEITDTPEPS